VAEDKRLRTLLRRVPGSDAVAGRSLAVLLSWLSAGGDALLKRLDNLLLDFFFLSGANIVPASEITQRTYGTARKLKRIVRARVNSNVCCERVGRQRCKEHQREVRPSLGRTNGIYICFITGPYGSDGGAGLSQEKRTPPAHHIATRVASVACSQLTEKAGNQSVSGENIHLVYEEQQANWLQITPR
jgi:hypothetical protein